MFDKAEQLGCTNLFLFDFVSNNLIFLFQIFFKGDWSFVDNCFSCIGSPKSIVFKLNLEASFRCAIRRLSFCIKLQFVRDGEILVVLIKYRFTILTEKPESVDEDLR